MRHLAIIFLCFVFIFHPLSGWAQTGPTGNAQSFVNDGERGRVISDSLVSTILQENKVGLDVTRRVMIYLPPSYESSGKSYPVVYYFHSIFGRAEYVFGGDLVTQQTERAFHSGVIPEFILVVPDFSTPVVGSLFENSPVSGRWLDYITREVIPFVDGKFRTLRHRDSRALAGDFMGGRGALKLAMSYADLFGVVYAMHPVALGMGYVPWADLGIDWVRIFNARSISDIPQGSRDQIFVGVCQAFLPNLSRPPFYCDYFMDLVDGALKVNVENMQKAKRGFHLDETLRESFPNLRQMNGIALDWARYDGNYDHIHAAREFSRELDDLGIEHEAEEYRGNPWNKVWTDDGRFYTRVLPFFARHLVFE